jgi:hypothetical protein
MKINRATPEVVSTREGHGGLTASGQQWSEDDERSPHGGEEMTRGVRDQLISSRDLDIESVHASPRNITAEVG